MRKLTAMLGAAAMLSIVPATPVLGQVVDTRDGICYMIVPDVNGALTGANVEGSLHVRSNKTWTTMTCHFDLTEDQVPPKTVHARGFPCAIPPLPPTTDTRATANNGGRMVLTCRTRTPAS
jgi:hypothetical protein